MKRREQIRAMVEDMGVDATAEHEGITRETVRRHMRRRSAVGDVIQDSEEIVADNALLKRIQARYSKKELSLLAKGGIPMEYKHTPVHSFSGGVFKIGYMTDTHIGSVYTNYDYIKEAFDIFADQEVDMIAHCGDVVEGMSNRAGHIYECTELGYDAQKTSAIEILSQADFCPLYMIDGNHDRWYIKSNGALMVKDICNTLEQSGLDVKFLGHDEGDIKLDSATVKLWHGEDSSSYALSYRLQKLIESLSGGDKPNILLAGHVHKYGKFFIRNIHCISCGCIQNQSKWMRGKRISAHTGFGIVTLIDTGEGIGRIKDEFYPLYS